MQSEPGLGPPSAAAEKLATGFPGRPSPAAASARVPEADAGKRKAPPAHSLDSEGLKELCQSQNSGIDTALALIAQRTREMTNASGVAIGLYAGEEVLCRARAGAAPEVGTPLEREHGLSGECLQTGQLVYCADTANDLRVDPAACRALNLRSAVAVPISCDGRVLGVFDVFSAERSFFDDRALVNLDEIAKVVAQVVAPLKSATKARAESEAVAAAAVAEPAAPEHAISSSIGPVRQSAVAAQTFGRMVLSEYFLIALVIVALGASVLGSYRSHRRAASPLLDVTRGLVEKTVPEESSTGPVALPTDPDALPPLAAHGSSTGKRSPAKRETEAMNAPQPVARPVPQNVTVRQPEMRLAPPVLTIPASQQETIVGVIQAPVTDPTLVQQLQPPQPEAGKPKRLSRALNGAKKPAKFLFGKNPKKEHSAEATPEPSQPSPPPQPSN